MSRQMKQELGMFIYPQIHTNHSASLNNNQKVRVQHSHVFGRSSWTELFSLLKSVLA